MVLCRTCCKMFGHDIRLNICLCIWHVVFFVGTKHVCATLSNISYNISNTQERIIANSNSTKHFINMAELLLVSKTKDCVNRDEILKKQRAICIDTKTQSRFLEQYGLNFNEYADTISHDDIVRGQYNLLPYPAVTQSEIHNIKLHYNGNLTNIPYAIHPATTLEAINHFLFRGNNLFK